VVHPRRLVLAAGIALASLGCANDSPPPEPAPDVVAPPAAEPPAPVTTDEKVYEVTLASTPGAAIVRLSGAEIGTTPHVLKYKRKTTVEITADGFLPAVVTVDETSDPNVVVALQPDPAAGAIAAAKGEPAKAGPAKAEPSPVTPTPAASKPTSGLPYPHVAAAKADYQQGKIDRDAYDQAVRKLKLRRNEKIAVIRAKYQAGEFDKDEYNRRKRIIDNEYKGTT